MLQLVSLLMLLMQRRTGSRHVSYSTSDATHGNRHRSGELLGLIYAVRVSKHLGLLRITSLNMHLMLDEVGRAGRS